MRDACLDRVAPDQLLLGPSQKVAAFPVDQRDPAVEVEGDQDHIGRVQVSLCPIPLMAQSRLDEFPLEDLVLELVDSCDLSRERLDQAFVILGEAPAVVPNETDPTVDMGG